MKWAPRGAVSGQARVARRPRRRPVACARATRRPGAAPEAATTTAHKFRIRPLALTVALAASVLAHPPAALPAGPFGSLPPPRLSEADAVRALVEQPKIASWLRRYPPGPQTDAVFQVGSRSWRVHVWSGKAGEIATGLVDDGTGAVEEAWSGPQVGWKMARGRPGAFGGRTLTAWPVWLLLTIVFVIGLADLRRPVAIRNLDLLALVGFGVPLLWFNEGHVFLSASLAAPLLAYLAARMAWIGFRRRPPRPAAPVWPVWLLIAASLFLVGFRAALNVQTPRSVIDVGYAGVIGADRILDGRSPYGAMPVIEGRPCGPADRDGTVRQRIQENGRCEAGNAHGDTYGPVAYLVYLPATAIFGWSGKWDSLPAAHATSIALDLLTLLGLVLVGRRLGGRTRRLAATLAFAWAAYPFTAYALMSNTNDALMPALLVWGFWLASSPAARGGATALAGWAKFAALLLVPLWSTYPAGLTRRGLTRFALGFGVTTLAAFSILLLEPDLTEALRTFWERTIEFQLDRDSPFSPWSWGQYHAAGIPDLAWAQRVVQVATLALAGFAATLPRRKEPLELAALTAAILLAVQLSLTHWFYLYLPWVLPFVVLALLLPRARPDAA